MKLILPCIGTGTLRTPGSYAALIISTEEEHGSRVDIVNSVIDALGISLAELEHYRKRPDCSFEAEYAEWEAEAERLEQIATLGPAQKEDDSGDD